MINIDDNNCSWERVEGYFTDLRIDSRWTLKRSNTGEPMGNLRIVSHPDLKPGYLRAVFTYVTSKKDKSKSEILLLLKDYNISKAESEVFSVDTKIQTETVKFEATLKELESMFNVKIFR